MATSRFPNRSSPTPPNMQRRRLHEKQSHDLRFVHFHPGVHPPSAALQNNNWTLYRSSPRTASAQRSEVTLSRPRASHNAVSHGGLAPRHPPPPAGSLTPPLLLSSDRDLSQKRRDLSDQQGSPVSRSHRETTIVVTANTARVIAVFPATGHVREPYPHPQVRTNWV